MIGRSSLHRSVRTFNVGRIVQHRAAGRPYQIPASFSIERYLGNAWHLIPEPGPDQEVVDPLQPAGGARTWPRSSGTRRSGPPVAPTARSISASPFPG